MEEKSVSIIIPSYNSASTIRLVIEALRSELNPSDQLIVVDDHSDDDTVRIAEELGAMVVENRHNPGAAGARNTGAEVALGDWLLFVDSDAVIKPAWREILDEWMKREVGAIQAIYAEEAAGKGSSTFYKNFYYHYTFTRRIRNRWLYGCGTFFFAVKRSLFGKAGGFDDKVKGASIEDADFAARLTATGEKIRLVPELEVFHLREYSFSDLIKYDWKMIAAKTRYLLRRGKGLGKPSLSMARPSELWAVTLGSFSVWVMFTGLILAPFYLIPCFILTITGFLGVAAGHVNFWIRSVKTGRKRGLIASLITFPDLMLVAPSAAFTIISFIFGGRKY